MIVNPYIFSTGGEYRVEIEVPTTSVASNLTDFPVYVDLSDLPAGFWDHVAREDGGDIRVKTSGGSEIAFDLVAFDRANETGSLFVKRSLSTVSATAFYIHYGDGDLEPYAPGDTYGRNAVWSDYHRVFFFGTDLYDHTGSQYDLTYGGTPDTFTQASSVAVPAVTSPQISPRGIEWDGSYWYITTANAIYKFDPSWTLVTSNTSLRAQIQTARGVTIDQLNDMAYADGQLFVTAWNAAGAAGQTIARVSVADLSLLEAADVDATITNQCRGIAWVPEDERLYVQNGSSFELYNTALVHQSTQTTRMHDADARGLAYFRGSFYYSHGSTQDVFWTSKAAGSDSAGARVFGLNGSETRGMCVKGGALRVLHDPDGLGYDVLTLSPYTTAAGAGAQFEAGDGRYMTEGVSKFTTWTLGATATIASKSGTANRVIWAYAPEGNNGDTNRTAMAFRDSTDRWSFWNTNDSWLDDTVSPTLDQAYRIVCVQNATTDRLIYRDGTLRNTDTGATQKPGGSAPMAIWIGIGDNGLTSDHEGEIGFLYLRDGALSADWIAAESSNLSAPASFYNVGTEETV